MSKIKVILKKTLTNPPILYVISRYATYIIQFINSLFIAVYLGPYYLGIWGFINLILGYLSQLNFGISHSVNVIVSVEKDKKEYVQNVIGNGFTMILVMCIAILSFSVISYFGGISIGEKYNFNTYTIPVSLIAILSHFNSLFSNIFRIYGKIFEIALNQSLFPVLTLLLILFFKGQNLLYAMIIVNLASVTIALLLFLIKTPIKLKFSFDFNLFKYIQGKGWHLFIYNSSIALIIITSKSFISSQYSVENFGYFTFSYSLANSILLFLNAMSFLIFPKMLNRFANEDNDYIQNLLRKIRTSYISTSHLLVHLLIMIFPFLLLIFPDYNPASDVFKVIALTIVLYTNSFGYQTILIARDKEKIIAIIASSALMLNVFLVPFFSNILNVHFSYVMFATMIVYLMYVLVSGIAGRMELGLSTRLIDVLKDIFPVRMFTPFIISVLLIISSAPNVLFIIPFAIYIILNFKDLMEVYCLFVSIINNPKFINI